MNISLLLSYRHLSKNNFKKPFIFRSGNGGQFIFYFGSNHSRDKNDLQYGLLEREWNEFIEHSENRKRIVFIEGGLPLKRKNKNEYIKNSGENGYAYFLAKKNHITVTSPEPPLSFQSAELLKKFSMSEVQYYYFARVVFQWQQLPLPRPDLKKYIQNFLLKDKKELKWKNFDFSIKHMELIHRKIFKKPIDYTDHKFFNQLLNPYRTGIVNRIHVETARLRDIHILENIKKEWKKEKCIFVVFGASHAVMQERVIKDFVGKKVKRKIEKKPLHKIPNYMNDCIN